MGAAMPALLDMGWGLGCVGGRQARVGQGESMAVEVFRWRLQLSGAAQDRQRSSGLAFWTSILAHNANASLAGRRPIGCTTPAQ